MVSKELLELLNKALAHELQVSIQYMWQHVSVTGIQGAVVENLFRETAISAMKHAEELAERLVYLNGVPTTKPNPVFVRTNLEEMLSENIRDEEEAILLYKEAIQLAGKEGDFGTKRLLEDILSHEEKQHSKFAKLLVGMTSPFTQP
jgi:bacterioferritin